jgi:hypothetical protein
MRLARQDEIGSNITIPLSEIGLLTAITACGALAKGKHRDNRDR